MTARQIVEVESSAKAFKSANQHVPDDFAIDGEFGSLILILNGDLASGAKSSSIVQQNPARTCLIDRSKLT